MKNIIQYEVAFDGEPATDTGGLKTDFLSGKLLPLICRRYFKKNH